MSCTRDGSSFSFGFTLEVEFSTSGISEIPNSFVQFDHGGLIFVILCLPSFLYEENQLCY
jgi:hypothetical protein